MNRSAVVPGSFRVLLGGAFGIAMASAHADVTVQQKMDFNVAIIKAHSNITELTSGDKQRRDADLQCDGAFMSFVCGRGNHDAHIVRLDKSVEWTLDPKKKEYRETSIANLAEQRSAAMERLKQCKSPVQQQQAGPDTSDCDMSPPKFESRKTDQHSVFAGHDARLSQLSMTQSCRNRKTGDTCDFVISMDSWLTGDTIAGVNDVKAFQAAYLKRLGLDGSDQQMQASLQQVLAPYQDALKQISLRAGDFKGYPLKTQVRISFGGAQCAAAQKMPSGGGSGGNGDVVADAGTAAADTAKSNATGEAGNAAGTAAGNAMGGGAAGSILGGAAGVFGQKLASGLAGGLFKKKSAPPAETPAAAAPVTPGMAQVAQITMETTAIDTSAIASDQFEIPVGYKLNVPKPRATKQESCSSSD